MCIQTVVPCTDEAFVCFFAGSHAENCEHQTNSIIVDFGLEPLPVPTSPATAAATDGVRSDAQPFSSVDASSIWRAGRISPQRPLLLVLSGLRVSSRIAVPRLTTAALRACPSTGASKSSKRWRHPSTGRSNVFGDGGRCCCCAGRGAWRGEPC